MKTPISNQQPYVTIKEKKRVLKEINIEQLPTQNKKTANKTKSKQRKSQTINKHLFNSTTSDYFRTIAAATTFR